MVIIFLSFLTISIVEIDFTNWNSNNKLRKVLNGSFSYKGTKQLIATTAAKYTPTSKDEENLLFIVNGLLGNSLSSLDESNFLQIALDNLEFRQNYIPSSIMQSFLMYQVFEMVGKHIHIPDTLLNSQSNTC